MIKKTKVAPTPDQQYARGQRFAERVQKFFEAAPKYLRGWWCSPTIPFYHTKFPEED